jgi:hypothetical protein
VRKSQVYPVVLKEFDAAQSVRFAAPYLAVGLLRPAMPQNEPYIQQSLQISG